MVFVPIVVCFVLICWGMGNVRPLGLWMSKTCKFNPDLRCFHLSCSIFHPVSGSVSVCPLFRGGDFFASRKVVRRVPVSPFSKHLRRK